MENTIEQRIEILKERGFDLSLGGIIEDSFNHWKKILFYGITAILFTYLFNDLITRFIGNMLGTNSIDVGFQTSVMETAKNPSASLEKILTLAQEYMSNPLIMKKVFLTSLISLLISPLGAGVVYCAYQFDKKGTASFKDLIIGFQGSRFINLIGLTIISTLIMIISIFTFFIPALYLIPALILSGAFIVINNVSLIKAMKYSIQIVNMKFLQVFSILIVSFLISKVLGVLLCVIGLILTLPFSFAVVYSLYKNTIGTIEETDEIDFISNP